MVLYFDREIIVTAFWQNDEEFFDYTNRRQQKYRSPTTVFNYRYCQLPY